jgi:nicotinamide mononucleotide (NMN) deamidase PncC
MAEAARDLLKADIGISSTATEETEGRPMGTTYIGVAASNGNRAVSRARRKQHIAAGAMFELRKSLLFSD